MPLSLFYREGTDFREIWLWVTREMAIAFTAIADPGGKMENMQETMDPG